MSGPWEQFAAPAAEEQGPWAQFSGAQPARGLGLTSTGSPVLPGALPGTEAPPDAAGMQEHVQQLQGQQRAAQATGGVMGALQRTSQIVAGAIDAGLNAATAVVNFIPGAAAGVVGNLATAGGELAAKGVTRVSRAARGVPLELPTDPSIGDASENLLTGKYMQATVHQPQTPQGREYAEEITAPVMNELAPLMGMHGTMTAAGEAAPAAVRATADATKAGASRAGEVAGTVASKVLKVDPELAKVAKTAGDLKYPIDVRPDQVIEKAKFSKLAGQAAADVPLSGSKTASNQTNFTRNLIDLLNPEETTERLTPDTFSKAMDRSGQGIGEITGKTDVPLDVELRKGLDALREDAEKFGTADDQRIVGNYIAEIHSKAGDDGVINGRALREINSEVGKRARAEVDSDLGRRLNDLQDTIEDAVQRNIADPEDAARLKDFRRQYAYGKIVEPLVAKTIDGKVSPQALMARVTATKQGKHFMARSAGGPIGQLAKVGQLIKEPASSGTAERSLIYGAGLGGGAYVEPHTAAAAYGAANAYNRLGPKLTRAMVRGKEQRRPPPPEPPAEPTTSPGAGGPRGGPGGPPPGPLGDLTPDWSTTPGAGGPRPGGGVPPVEPTGLVPPVDEVRPLVPGPKPNLPKNAGKEIPAVPGRPDLADTMVAGRPSEVAASEATGREMQGERATQARRTQEAEAAARREASKPRTGPTMAETQRLIDAETSPAVKKVLQDHLATLKAEETAREGERVRGEDADALERAARSTTDTRLQARLLKQADAVRGAEKVPTGQAKEVPMGHGVGEPPKVGKVPTGKATEITPEYIEADRAWRAEFKLGEQDAERARKVAQALAIDKKAVEAAVQQHEKSPVRFDREIEKIIEGAKNADEAQHAAEGGAGDAGKPVHDEANQRPGVREGSGGEGGEQSVPAAERGAEGNAEPVAPAAVRPADEHAGANGVRETAGGSSEANAAGGQAAPRAQGKPFVGKKGVDIREVDGGFDAYVDGKKVGYLRDNLERGQAEALGENANVNIVKVDPEFRGKSIGRALYKAFEEKHGGRIAPSGKTEPAAWALWKRNYPEKVDAFVKQEAQRIRDGADRDMVIGNIKDPEIAERIAKEAGKPPEPPKGGAFEQDLHAQGGARDVTETPAFRKWSGGARVVDMAESRAKGFTGDEPVVVQVIHGTTGDFDTFSRTKANPESDHGAGFYFTNTPEDAAHNYATPTGPDMQLKVENLAEMLANNEDISVDEALKQAREQLSANEGASMPVYVRFKKPLVIGGPKESFLGMDHPYDEATGDFVGEPHGPLVDFLNGLRDELHDSRYNLSPREIDKIMGEVSDRVLDNPEGMRASDLDASLRAVEELSYVTDYDDAGVNAAREIARKAYQAAGYDGIIDQTVNSKFGTQKPTPGRMRGMGPSTKHFIAFEPEQVKSSIGNRGTFDPNDPNILHAQGPVWRSPLRDFIDNSKMVKGTPEQWRGFLKNAKGVKADEIKWSGLDDYLKLREPTEDAAADTRQADMFGVPTAKGPGAVTKKEIQAFLDNGGVKITEEQLGGPAPEAPKLDVPQEMKDWLSVRGTDPDEVSRREGWGRWASHLNQLMRENEQRIKHEQEYIVGNTDPESVKASQEYIEETQKLVDHFRRLRDLANEYNRATEGFAATQPAATKYSNWKLPGGENYRELLLQLASNTDKTFDRSHWNQDNNLMHVRATDRVDAQGRKGLHVEEIQSDWAQKGRKFGIDEPEQPANKAKPVEPVEELPEGWKYRVHGQDLELMDPKGNVVGEAPHRDFSNAMDPATHMAHAVQLYNRLQGSDAELARRADMAARRMVFTGKSTDQPPVPNAPFIGKTEAWAGLGIKRLVKMAADEGYAFVTFSTGEQNAAHYDLRKQVQKIAYDPSEGRLYAYDERGREVLDEKVAPTVDALEEYIGREPAQKLFEKIENHEGGEVYDPDIHGSYDVVEDEGEPRYYLSDHEANNVRDRYDDTHYFESHSEAREAKRNFTVEETGNGTFYLEDHKGKALRDEHGDSYEFDTAEEAEQALRDITVEEEPGESRYVVYGPDGEWMAGESYESRRQAERAAREYQEEHEAEINGQARPEISGLDLVVGGEGMVAFYDKIIPNVTKNVLKQLGGKGDELKMIDLGKRYKPERYTVVREGDQWGVRTDFGDGSHNVVHAVDREHAFTMMRAMDERQDAHLASQPKPASDSNVGMQPGFDITPAMKEATQGGVPMFRQGERNPNVVGSAEALDRVLRDKFGEKLIDGLQKEGILKYALQSEEQPEGSRSKAVMHQKAMTPHATLYYDRISAQEAPAILMHELGEHYGIVRLLGHDRYKIMLDDLTALKKADAPEVAEAWDYVKDRYVRSDTQVREGDTIFMREVAARLVEKAPDLPWVRRIINEIRAFFYEHFGTTMGNRVDANLIRGLAASALRKASAGDLPRQIPGMRPTAPAPFRPFVPRSQGGTGLRPQA